MHEVYSQAVPRRPMLVNWIAKPATRMAKLEVNAGHQLFAIHWRGIQEKSKKWRQEAFFAAEDKTLRAKMQCDLLLFKAVTIGVVSGWDANEQEPQLPYEKN